MTVHSRRHFNNGYNDGRVLGTNFRPLLGFSSFKILLLLKISNYWVFYLTTTIEPSMETISMEVSIINGNNQCSYRAILFNLCLFMCKYIYVCCFYVYKLYIPISICTLCLFYLLTYIPSWLMMHFYFYYDSMKWF